MNNFNDSDWQNFIYLSLLLTVLVVSNLFRPTMSRKKVIKYFFGWSAIGLVAVCLYSYRFEFSAFKNRILGELNPSNPRVKGDKIIINLSQDGHYYIDLKINSIPVRFMIDTGASDVAINAKDAARIGFDLQKLNYNKLYQTANGKAFGANVILKEVEINGIKFQEVTASVNNSDMGISLLGMSFLSQFRKYEFYQDRLELSL